MKYFYASLLVLLMAGTRYVYAQDDSATMAKIQGMVDAGETQMAMEMLEQRIEQDESDVQAHFLKGLLLLRQGETGEARGVFSEIARLFPELPEAFNNLAAIYAREGEYEKAQRALISARANAPEYPLIHSNLGDLYVKMAVDAYRRSLQLDSADDASAAKLEFLERMFEADDS
jgi:Flp pilus assembly protein TadD